MNQTSQAAQRTDSAAVVRTATELAALGHMTGADLAEKYLALFGKAARSRNKDFLRKRVVTLDLGVPGLRQEGPAGG